MKKLLLIIFSLSILLLSCNSSDSQSSSQPSSSASPNSSQPSSTAKPSKELDDNSIPVIVQNKTKDVSLYYVGMGNILNSSNPYLVDTLSPEDNIETSWVPVIGDSDYGQYVWFSFSYSGEKKHCRLAEDVLTFNSISLLLEEKDNLYLTLTGTKKGSDEKKSYSYIYDEVLGVWHRKSSENKIYASYIIDKSIDYTFGWQGSTNQTIGLTSFEPLYDIKFWSRPYSQYDEDNPYGSDPIVLEADFGVLEPGEYLVTPGLSNPNGDRHFVTYKDKSGKDYAQLILASKTPKEHNPDLTSFLLSDADWALAKTDPKMYIKEYNTKIVNNTPVKFDSVTAKIGDKEFSICSNLKSGESFDKNWTYTGSPFQNDIVNETSGGWAPVFILEIYGEFITADNLKVYTDDLRDEFVFDASVVAFFQNKDSSFFCSPQEDFASLIEDADVSPVDYLYLSQVNRWLYRAVPQQLLFAAGVMDSREFSALFPEKADMTYPTIGSVAVVVTYKDIYLDDVEMTFSETGSYQWEEKTKSDTKTLFTTKDLYLISADHIRGPSFYYRYRGTYGAVLRQYFGDSQRDSNNGGIYNVVIDMEDEYNKETYILEDIK